MRTLIRFVPHVSESHKFQVIGGHSVYGSSQTSAPKGRFSFVGHEAICRGADKFLAPPTSLCILFDGENISFDDSFVIMLSSKIENAH